MDAKSTMFSALAPIWIITAIVCATLPIFHSVLGSEPMRALVAALVLGGVVGLILVLAARRLLGTGKATGDGWGSLAPGLAAAFGVFTWGLPVGLIMGLDQFLPRSNLAGFVINLVIMSLGGALFGLTMRWFAVRKLGAT